MKGRVIKARVKVSVVSLQKIMMLKLKKKKENNRKTYYTRISLIQKLDEKNLYFTNADKKFWKQ